MVCLLGDVQREGAYVGLEFNKMSQLLPLKRADDATNKEILKNVKMNYCLFFVDEKLKIPFEIERK